MITNLFAWQPEEPLCEECELRLDYLPITGTHFMFHCWGCGRCYKPILRDEAKMVIGQPGEVDDPYVLFENRRYGAVTELRIGSIEDGGQSVRIGPPLLFEDGGED